ncbi:MAG: transglycosylase family protein [Rhodoferax sp.]|nr:transglycosylase family protein [Rhodoferax sp.]
MPKQLLRLLLLLSMLFGGLVNVNAATVTADQVKAAILASPTASAQMKSYASAIGSLAMIESSGNTAAYNGSCCYGVLQLNTANIQAAMGAGFKPQDFQNLPLQT